MGIFDLHGRLIEDYGHVNSFVQIRDERIREKVD